MKETLIALLNQLLSALDGSVTQTQRLDTTFQTPVFRSGKARFIEPYTFDEFNNQIISHLMQHGYKTPKDVVDLPKVVGQDIDLVINTKGIYELNKTDNIQGFAKSLFESLLSFTHQFEYDLGERQTTLTMGKEDTFSLNGIYINIRIPQIYLLKHLTQIQENPETFGTINHHDYTGKKLMMEYSSPNMAKSMSIGHFRNTVIGQIMYNILQQTGCEHFNWNYVGDRGTAFGKFIVSLHYHYQQDSTIVEQILANPESMMGVVYGRFKEIEVSEKEEKARKIVELLEADNQVIVQLWLEIRKLSLMDFETVYEALDVHFDCSLGESFSVKLHNNVLEDLKAKDLVHESQGALIIKLKRSPEGLRKPLTSSELDTREEGRDQVVVFAKSDGSTLYAPRDLALLKRRTSQLKTDKLIYVVGSEQSVYFEHLITLGKALGYIQDNQMMHLGYGLYLQNGKKMASRSGGAYRAMELIDEITNSILAQFEDRLDHDTAQKLAISALIINDTKGDISKDVNLDIPSMTKLNGDTGIYVQYTAVRMRSLLARINENSTNNHIGNETICEHLDQTQKHLLFLTSLLPLKTATALDMYKPHVLTQYLLELAGLLNKWYNDSPKILEMNNEEQQTVTVWLQACLTVLEKVMALLHMPRVEKM